MKHLFSTGLILICFLTFCLYAYGASFFSDNPYPDEDKAAVENVIANDVNENGIPDTTDADTQLTEEQVDAFADNNGYLESESDPTVDSSAEIQAIIGAGIYEPADATITKSDEAETLTENWINILNPWADNEISSASTWNAKPTISSGAGAPSSTPTKVGDIYIDTTGDASYTAVGTSSSTDWQKDNDGGLTWEVISTNTPAVNGRGYLIDASGGDVTLTAVGPPSTGDIFGISDYTNSANANAITLARNNSGIESKEEDLVIDIDGASFNVVYSDADRGWSIDRFVGRHNAVPQSERDALIAFYEATGGDSWTDNTGWLEGNFSVNNWFGVTVTDGHVTGISLPDNNLVGAAGATLDPLSDFLTSLYCQYNSISTLDVSALTSLARLNCRDNTISALDVSALTSLTSLNCYSNTISTLDVSALTSLTSLSCYTNTISTLDVSALTSLTNLNCGNNTISILDVSALTSLTSLNCYSNTISTLDVSALTLLTSLSCGDNTISALDVSALTSLTSLNCYNNTISALDVSALTSLTSLYCYNNTISALDVSALTSLTSLSCQNNTMIEAEVDNIICDIDVAGVTDGTLSIAGTNAAPSAAGLICKGNLETDDWDVDVTVTP